MKTWLVKTVGKLRGWPGVALLVVAFLASAVVLLWIVPLVLTPTNLDPLQRAELQNELRRTWAQVLLGLVILGTFVVTWWRASVADKAVNVSRGQQITERFTRAVEQLGSDKLAIRLGGIYALERIARDSARDHWQVMEVLTAYVREYARWEGERYEGVLPVSDESDEHQQRADIQAILTVLGRRRIDYETEGQRLDFSEADLRGANLQDTNLQRAFFWGTHLGRARLWRANLEDASLIFSNLEGASLTDARLQRARLWGTDLQIANLGGTSFQGANLMGANLADVEGLTQEQIGSAIIDENTILPDYLRKE